MPTNRSAFCRGRGRARSAWRGRAPPRGGRGRTRSSGRARGRCGRCGPAPRSRRTTLPPSGSGRPVSSFHQRPRSTTSRQPLVARRSAGPRGSGGPPRRLAVAHAPPGSGRSGGSASSRRRAPRARAPARAVVHAPGRGDRRPRREAIRSRAIGAPRDDDGTVAVAEGRAVRQEQVAVGQVRVGVEGDGGDGELAGHRAAVQRLDVGELVGEGEPLGVDAALRRARRT